MQTGSRRGAHRKQSPARTGLLGASAALTVGAMAMGSGVLPGAGERFTLNDSRDIQAHEGGRSLHTGSPTPDVDRTEERSSRDTSRSPSPTPSATEETQDPSPEPEESEETPEPEETEESEPTASAPASTPAAAPNTSAPAPAPTTSSPTAAPSSSSPSSDPAQSEAAAVLQLVNQERAKAGCQPVTHDAPLARLATDFSRDMAERGFFSHTDPDGRSPWDRAEAAGIRNLGGENIARGQRNAAAVMEAWMNSDGHRANILNCNFKTLGVGVHHGSGGPWWTQNFGY